MVLGTFTNTVLALETSGGTAPKISNTEQSQNGENVSKTSESTKNEETLPEKDDSTEPETSESSTTQHNPDKTVNSEQQEKSDVAIGESAKQINHKMGTFANGDSSGQPMLRLGVVPTIYSDDTSLPRRDVVDIASKQSWMTQNDFKK